MADITWDAAWQIANQTVASIRPATDDQMVLLPKQTREVTSGWVFFYAARRWVETGDFRFIIAGNAPFIVDRRDGSVHFTGTAEAVDTYIREYESRRPLA
jgi:hypothetical protein